MPLAANAATLSWDGDTSTGISGGTHANSSVQIFDFESFSGNFTTVNFTGLGVGQSAVFNATTGFVTVIPEPQAALIGGIGMLALLRRCRD